MKRCARGRAYTLAVDIDREAEEEDKKETRLDDGVHCAGDKTKGRKEIEGIKSKEKTHQRDSTDMLMPLFFLLLGAVEDAKNGEEEKEKKKKKN